MRLTRMMAVVALAAALPAVPAELSAQSSLFGVRGLGQPGRPVTPRTRATGGSFGLFDGESDANPAAMANLLGDLWKGAEPRWERAFKDPGVKLHLYGKGEARPGRKMGHLTALASTPAEAERVVRAARGALRKAS